MSGFDGIPNFHAQVAAAVKPMQPTPELPLEKYLSSEPTDLGKTPHEKASHLVTLAGPEAAKLAETMFGKDIIQQDDRKAFRDAILDHLKKVNVAINGPDGKEKEKAQHERDDMEKLALGLNITAQSGNASDSLGNYFQGSPQAARFANNYTSIILQEVMADYPFRVTPAPEQGADQGKGAPPPAPKKASPQR